MNTGILESKKRITVPDVAVNTFIGGVAYYITDADQLASALNVEVSKVTKFAIVNGTDIEAAVDAAYMWRGLSGLTHFYDRNTTGGGCIGLTSGNSFNTGTYIRILYLPNLTYIATGTHGAFNAGSIKDVYMPNLITIGPDAGSTQIIQFSNFNNAANPMRLFCHPSLETANNGAVEGDILSFLSYAGRSVGYVSNFSKPAAVNNLAVDNGFSINLTPPASVNPIRHYDIFLNDIYNNRMEAGGAGFLKNLTYGENYNVKVIALDDFYNESPVSNIINKTFLGFSLINNLTVSEVFDNLISLTFTSTSENPIDYYNVFVDGLLNNTCFNSPAYARDLEANTSYQIKIQAVDIRNNKSAFSNTVTQSTNSTEIPFRTTNLVSFYKLDEASPAATILDSYGTDHLTATDMTYGEAGKIGTALRSTTGSSNVKGNVATSITGHFTLNIWVYRTANAVGNSCIFEHGNFSAGFGIWAAGTTVSWRINGYYNNYSLSLITLPLNSWSMITLIYDGVRLIFYQDGVRKGYVLYSTNPANNLQRQLFSRNGQPYYGRLDLAGIWNAGITEKDVIGLFKKGNASTI